MGSQFYLPPDRDDTHAFTPACYRYSLIYRPRKDERLSWPRWLLAGYTKMDYPETVTHPSINWARRRVTTLIKTNALPLAMATPS